MITLRRIFVKTLYYVDRTYKADLLLGVWTPLKKNNELYTKLHFPNQYMYCLFSLAFFILENTMFLR